MTHIAYIAQAGETGAKQQAEILGDHLEDVTFVSGSTLDYPADEPYHYDAEANVVYPTQSLAAALRALDPPPDVVLVHVLNDTVRPELAAIQAHFPVVMRAGLHQLETWLNDDQRAAGTPASIATLQQFDHLIAPSDSTARDLRTFGISKERISVVPSTIDFQAAQEPDFNAIYNVGCLSSRVTPLKNQITLVLALGAMRELDPTMIPPLFLPGGPQQRANTIQGIANTIGLGGFVRVGMYYLDPVQEFWPRIAVHCLPSFGERMPLVVLEAARAGVPTVAADAAWAETFESIETAPADDPWAWGEQILELVQNDARRVRVARAQQRELAERFDVRVVAPQYEQVFEHVIDHCGRFKFPGAVMA